MFQDVLAVLLLLVKIPWTYLQAFIRLFWSPVVPIAGKVAVVTGSGSGLGREIALRLAAQGARLALWDINENGNKATADLIRQKFPESETFLYKVDVTNKDAVKAAALKVQREVGHVYMLVNNAGILIGETILDIEERQIEKTIDVNLVSHFWTIRAFLPAMLNANSGHIVTTCSTASISGSLRVADYCASKFGVAGLVESLEIELRHVYKKDGIKQTLVCPHFLDTGLIHSVEQRFQGGGSALNKTSEAADFIMDRVLQQKRYVYYPQHFQFFGLVKNFLPNEGRLAMVDFFNIEIASQKTGRPHKDRGYQS